MEAIVDKHNILISFQNIEEKVRFYIHIHITVPTINLFLCKLTETDIIYYKNNHDIIRHNVYFYYIKLINNKT